MSRRAEFATWSRPRSGVPPLAADLRAATPADAAAIAGLSGRRNRVEPAKILPRVLHDLEAIEAGDARRACFVALSDGAVIGYGKARWEAFADADGARNAPTGWYLTGLVVDPGFRRRGVGAALTAVRLEHLVRAGASEILYFANAENRVTIDLHARFGFVEVTRDFAIPGVTFSGGTGILFRRGEDA